MPESLETPDSRSVHFQGLNFLSQSKTSQGNRRPGNIRWQNSWPVRKRKLYQRKVRLFLALWRRETFLWKASGLQAFVFSEIVPCEFTSLYLSPPCYASNHFSYWYSEAVVRERSVQLQHNKLFILQESDSESLLLQGASLKLCVSKSPLPAESQNILGWKQPSRITEVQFLLLIRTIPVVAIVTIWAWGYCPNACWTLESCLLLDMEPPADTS